MGKTTDLVAAFNAGRIAEVRINREDPGDPVLSVNFTVPVPGFVSPVTMEEHFQLHDPRLKKLQSAVNGLYDAIEDVIENGDNTSREPCATCTSPCCTHYAESIIVSHEDVARIEAAGYNASQYFTPLHAHDVSIYGHAQLKLIPGQEEATCIFFDDKKRQCGIHKIKPQVCSAFSEHTCTLYQIDIRKSARVGKKRARR